MFTNKRSDILGYVFILIGVLLCILSITDVFGVTKANASVIEKITSLRIYMSQESSDASVISAFNNGGTPGLIISSSKVVIGDSLYVGPNLEYSSKVLTEKDIERIKDEISKQIYEELKQNGCFK